jgi:hypothetical protein
MSNYELTNFDVLMIHAAAVETHVYGTLRMVKEETVYFTGPDDVVDLSARRGLIDSSTSGQLSLNEYFFESLTPDFDESKYAIWDMIADDQNTLKEIFELFAREGVGYNPTPPAGVLSQNMTWFYSSEDVIERMRDLNFVNSGIVYLQTTRASSDFEESQRIAALVTFAKHKCRHNWDGESEFWSCKICGEYSFTVQKP